jgi:hypothetical protein
MRHLRTSLGFTLIETTISTAIGLAMTVAFVWLFLDFQRRAQDRANLVDDAAATETLRDRLRPQADCKSILALASGTGAGATYIWKAADLPSEFKTEGVQQAEFTRLKDPKSVAVLVLRLKSGREMRLPISAQFGAASKLRNCSSMIFDDVQELSCPNESL